jgi:hypothetical protein
MTDINMWAFEEKDRLRSLFGAQDKELWNQCRFIQMILRDAERTLDPRRTLDIADCRRWLCKAHAVLKKCWIRYTAYDEAWASLLEIRHRLCWILPERELVRIALGIRDDLEYLKDEKEKKESEHRIRKIIAALTRAAGRSGSEEGDESEEMLLIEGAAASGTVSESEGEGRFEELNEEIVAEVVQVVPLGSAELDRYRAELNRLSLQTAMPRQTRWYKINLYRTRLLATAGLMAIGEGLIVGGMIFWYDSVGIPRNLQFAVLGVVAFGILGGFLSAVSAREAVTAGSAAFYIERVLLVLRPVVGAAAALVVYIAQLAKVVTIGPADGGIALFFVVAFASGFSERFILKQLGSFLKPDDKDSKDK